MAEYDASSDLCNVRCPTLVLHSPHDNVAPFDEGRLIAATIPGALFAPFESRNHTPLPGEPAFHQVMRAVDQFVHGDSPQRRSSESARPALRSVAR
jgi:pimeloyl-ACP methyl ester carboxylesterase